MSYDEIPSDTVVANTLGRMGEKVKAVDLCKALVQAGYPTRESQLAIQRAAERGKLRVNSDWTLSLRENAAAA